MWTSLLFLASLVQVGLAVPFRLHNRIVFTRGNWVQGVETVWTMNADGSDQKRIWRVPKGYGQFGGFSRDGRWALSYNSFNVYRHDLTTKRIQQVLVWSNGWGTNVQQPSFSPDGKWILCEIGDANQNESETYVVKIQADKPYNPTVDPRSTEIKPIGENVPPENLWSAPRWSTDGKQIVVVGGPSYSYAAPNPPGSQSDVWSMNADGTNARRVTNNPAWDLAPCLNKDGTIVFVRRLDMDQSRYDTAFYSYNLWVADTQDHSEKQITFNPKTYDEMVSKNMVAIISSPLFSPDGKRVLFNETTGRPNGPYVSGIYQIGVDGTNYKRISDGTLVQ